jgi:hypothetical protein
MNEERTGLLLGQTEHIQFRGAQANRAASILKMRKQSLNR